MYSVKPLKLIWLIFLKKVQGHYSIKYMLLIQQLLIKLTRKEHTGGQVEQPHSFFSTVNTKMKPCRDVLPHFKTFFFVCFFVFSSAFPHFCFAY